MPNIEFPLTVVIQSLENETLLIEALGWPEIARCGIEPQRLRRELQANLRHLIEMLSPLELHRRRDEQVPEIGEVAIELSPPRHSLAWREPVTLKFPVLRWSRGETARLAYLPALGISVVTTSAATREKLEEIIPKHIRLELSRRQAVALHRLARLQRCQAVRIEELSLTAALATPKKLAAQAAEDEAAKKSVLAEVATDLTKETLSPAFEADAVVAQLVEALIGRRPRSVLLVGRSGVGKTAAVHELVRRRTALQLGQTPFWATSGARLVAGMSGFGMWQERCQKLWREAVKAKAVLHLGNLVELMEVGKSASGGQGIAGFLRPYIARGDLLVIAECTPEQLPVIEREDPHLLETFYRLEVEEPGVAEGRAILLGCALAEAERNAEPPLELDALERLDRLHRRYATYSAYPGRPVRFLRNLLTDRPANNALTTAEVTAAFARETGLPQFLLDEAVPLDLTAARAWFAGRVIGQPEAVELIVDLLAAVKAELTRPRKPLASLLFIGPTGVGKTEMAKALAEFLFRDRARLTRFDMSEYADAAAVNRLIGGNYGAEGLLTARVREQPFAVVLLDEFEKAHPAFFDLLLQMLGEGRLTDALGRVADFRNAVVIMTSNLGAESFQRGTVGFAQTGVTRRAAASHFTAAVRQALRPELFNRLDRIVPFAPLDEETVCHIAARELERIKQRDGLRYRGVPLHVADGVTQRLAQKGHDPRYGARPLKRLIERELLAPLAEQLNQHTNAALAAELRVAGETVELNVRRLTGTAAAEHSAADLARGCVTLRRDTQALEHCPDVLELHNEIFRLERLEQLLARRVYKSPEDVERVAGLPPLKRLAQSLAEFARRVNELERTALLAVYGKAACDEAAAHRQLLVARTEWRELLLTMHALRFKPADAVTLAVYSESGERLFLLAAAYYRQAVGSDCRVVLRCITPLQGGDARIDASKEGLAAVKKPERFLAEPHAGVIGIVLGIAGRHAYPRFAPERGLHLFSGEKQTEECFVHTSEAALNDYQPPASIARKGTLKQLAQGEKRRFYNLKQFVIEDPHLKRKWPWAGREIDDVLAEAIEAHWLQAAQTLIAER